MHSLIMWPILGFKIRLRPICTPQTHMRSLYTNMTTSQNSKQVTLTYNRTDIQLQK